MQRIKNVFIFFCMFVLLSCSFAFADELDTPTDITVLDVLDKIENDNFGDDLVTVLDVKANPVTPSNSSGFHRVMINLLGNYEPVTVDYTYQTSSSYLQHSITTDPDWSWICSAAIFGLVVFCFFRLIGGLFVSRK